MAFIVPSILHSSPYFSPVSTGTKPTCTLSTRPRPIPIGKFGHQSRELIFAGRFTFSITSPLLTSSVYTPPSTPSITTTSTATASNPAVSASSTQRDDGIGGSDIPSASSSSTTASRLMWPDLKPEQFRHPLDLEATRVLERIPGISSVVRDVLGNVASQVLYLDNIGTGVLVGEQQLPHLYALLKEACAILDVDEPQLYVRQSPVPNAYTLAISGRRPFIVVHTGLVELLTLPELQAVIAHELGHLKCDHGVYMTAANILLLAASIPGWTRWIARTLEDRLLAWSRCAELTCDRAALMVAGDSKVVVSTLMKLAGGSPSLAPHMSADAFLAQARAYDEALYGPVGDAIKDAQTTVLTHPLPVLRAREIDRFAGSPHYRALVRRAKPFPRESSQEAVREAAEAQSS